MSCRITWVKDRGKLKTLNSERDKTIAGLLILGQQGDQSAYETFLIEAAAILRAYLRKRMDSEMVEDVLQDTLLSIHRFRHTFLAGRPVGPWMYAICSHRIADHYRRKRRIQLVESDIGIDEHRASQIETRNQVLSGTATEAVRALPQRQRQVIELLKIEGLSVKEVALQTGMSESSVKTTAFRGYETIRKRFGTKK
jgi:RNA polymerase sigma-70 factor, ECF subfamily